VVAEKAAKNYNGLLFAASCIAHTHHSIENKCALFDVTSSYVLNHLRGHIE